MATTPDGSDANNSNNNNNNNNSTTSSRTIFLDQRPWRHEPHLPSGQFLESRAKKKLKRNEMK